MRKNTSLKRESRSCLRHLPEWRDARSFSLLRSNSRLKHRNSDAPPGALPYPHRSCSAGGRQHELPKAFALLREGSLHRDVLNAQRHSSEVSDGYVRARITASAMRPEEGMDSRSIAPTSHSPPLHGSRCSRLPDQAGHQPSLTFNETHRPRARQGPRPAHGPSIQAHAAPAPRGQGPA